MMPCRPVSIWRALACRDFVKDDEVFMRRPWRRESPPLTFLATAVGSSRPIHQETRMIRTFQSALIAAAIALAPAAAFAQATPATPAQPAPAQGTAATPATPAQPATKDAKKDKAAKGEHQKHEKKMKKEKKEKSGT
jgi:hypothetical protein